MTQNRAWLFEAKGIQKWVLDNDRLADIQQASALLAGVANSDKNDLFHVVAAQVKFDVEPERRAGAVIALTFTEDQQAAFTRFRALWRLAFMQLFPGLEFNERLSDWGEAGANPNPYLGKSTSFVRDNGVPALLPKLTPLTRVEQRTGRAAVNWEHGEDIDALTLAKRMGGKSGDRLGDKLDPNTVANWPNMMEPDAKATSAILFDFADKPKRIAVIHADISGLGALYTKLRDAGTNTKAASEAVEKAIMGAAISATDAIVKPALSEAESEAEKMIWPMRPILIGGDDITLIVRADLAIPFARHFLKTLETLTEENRDIGHRLTAGAGIAIGKPKQPFFRLLAQAEELCSYAKKKSKSVSTESPPSALAFHRITQSAIHDDAEQLSLWGDFEGKPIRLTTLVYGVGPGKMEPTLGDLEKVKDAFKPADLNTGSLRALRTGMATPGGMQRAEDEWQRWRSVTSKRAGGALNDLDIALGLTTEEEAKEDNKKVMKLADLIRDHEINLFDALEWSAING